MGVYAVVRTTGKFTGSMVRPVRCRAADIHATKPAQILLLCQGVFFNMRVIRFLVKLTLVALLVAGAAALYNRFFGNRKKRRPNPW
jgi:hypothetical protein